MPDCGPDTTVSQLKDFFRQFASTYRGAKCPACGRRVQINKTKLHAQAIRALAAFYSAGSGYHHVGLVRNDADVARAVGMTGQFGLMEERYESGVSTGEWRVTEKGRALLEERGFCEKYVATYDGRVLSRDYLKPEHRDTLVTARQALGEHFDMDEILGVDA